MKPFLLITRQWHIILILVLDIGLIAVKPSMAATLSPEAAETIYAQYPDAIILEQRRDSWHGQMVTEVNIQTVEGKQLEVTLSDQGKILDVEKESSLPIIGGTLMIGAGVQGENAFYKGADDEMDIAPFLRYENGMFELQAYDGIKAIVTPLESNGYYFSVLGTYDMGEGYDPDDSDYLKGVDKLDDTINVGFEVGKNIGKWNISLQGLQEVTGEHDGQEVSLEFSRHIDMGSLTLRPSLSASWLSSDMVDYYYGVSSHEVRSDRKLYSPDSSYEVELQLLFEQELIGNFSLIGYVGLGLPGSEITDSPLVDDDYEFTGVLGLAYTF